MRRAARQVGLNPTHSDLLTPLMGCAVAREGLTRLGATLPPSGKGTQRGKIPDMKRTTVEIWKPIVGYEGLYEVSSWGRVRSLDRDVEYEGKMIRRRKGKILAQQSLKGGHLRVTLCREGKREHRLVHRLVLEAFEGPCPEGHEALHWNDDPTDNRWPENLRWGTRSENTFDKVRNGRHYQARKTHCDNGHEFTESNTYRRPSDGHRQCRTCKADRSRAYRQRKA